MTIRKKQRLALDAIREGMIVAEPVFFEEDRPVFFSEGSIVTARLIRWLKRAGQTELSVYVEEQPSMSQEAGGRTYQLLLGGMQDIFQSLRKGAALQDGQVNQLAEKALAHTIRSEAEAAYQRGDLLTKRAEMMQAWAKYCAKAPRS